MDFLEHELEEILKIFRDESEEQIQKLNKNLLKLETNPKDHSVISELFREAHSLKGAARMIGLDDIQSIAHKLEDVLGLAKENKLNITSEIIDSLCKTVDAIASIINESIETRGKSESNEIEPVIKALENIINGSDNIQERGTVEPAESAYKHASSSIVFTKGAEEVKKLITQIKVNIEKLKVFSTSIDALEEFLFFLNELHKHLESCDNQRIIAIIQDIKLKIESTIRGSGVLTDSEVSEIEASFDDFILVYERLTYNPEDKPVEPLNETVEEPEIVEEPDFIKNIHIFSQHTEDNIQKFQDVISKLNDLSSGINNNQVREIIEKITEILVFSKEKAAPLNQDMINVIEESFTAAIQTTDSSQETKEDPGLILQRITVLQQILKLAVQNEIVPVKAKTKEEDNLSKATLPPIRKNADIFPKNDVGDEEKLKQFDLKFGDTSTIKTLRVDTQKLDQLVNQVGELIIAKI